MATRKLVLFLVLTFAIGWLFQGMAIWAGEGGHLWVTLVTWTPLLAALLTGRETRLQMWLRVKRAGWAFWPLALVIGWSFSGGPQLMLAATGAGHWHEDMFRMAADRQSIDSIHHIGVLLGTGQQGFGYFALNLLLTISVASTILMLTGAIGEEAGWRGVLQPELETRFGVLKGTLLVGLIWGYWHLPVNMAGLNDVDHPLLQSFLIFPIDTVAMAFALAWLVKKTGSIWPAALAHAANNVLSSGALMVPNGWKFEQLTNTVTAVAVGSIFAWLLVRMEANQPVR